MTKAARSDEIDGVAWQFLCSPFARRDYWDMPLERRIDGFLRQLKRLDILNDGAVYGTLIDRVMANISRARRDGILEPPKR